MLCNACKNTKSTERCSAKALKNMSFCGKHAKAKNPKIWKEQNHNVAIKIQKIWRGFNVRRCMKLRGPGVLNRKVRHNDEELFTFADNVHPENYFAFEEDGKNYWFDFRTIYQICSENLSPVNPYTRKHIDHITRQRLRELAYYREMRLLPLYHNALYSQDRDKVLANRWICICQHLEEFQQDEVNPLLFTELNRTQLWEFTALLRASMLSWAREHNKPHSRRNIYFIWITNCWRRQSLEVDSAKNVTFYLGGTILKILKDCKITNEVCFQILGARYGL